MDKVRVRHHIEEAIRAHEAGHKNLTADHLASASLAAAATPPLPEEVEKVVERWRNIVLVSGHYDDPNDSIHDLHEVGNELAETVTRLSRERDEAVKWEERSESGSHHHIMAFMARAEKAEAQAAVMRTALEIIAGKRQCADNLMSNVEVAIAALSTPSPSVRLLDVAKIKVRFKELLAEAQYHSDAGRWQRSAAAERAADELQCLINKEG